MTSPDRRTLRPPVARLILALEAFGFLVVVPVVWLDALLDLPRLFFGAPPAPLRLSECIFESTPTLLLGIGAMSATYASIRRIAYLESLVVVCAWCRRVGQDGQWFSLEGFLERRHQAQTSHRCCEACASKPVQKI